VHVYRPGLRKGKTQKPTTRTSDATRPEKRDMSGEFDLCQHGAVLCLSARLTVIQAFLLRFAKGDEGHSVRLIAGLIDSSQKNSS
jgi:hypothetical protein